MQIINLLQLHFYFGWRIHGLYLKLRHINVKYTILIIVIIYIKDVSQIISDSVMLRCALGNLSIAMCIN